MIAFKNSMHFSNLFIYSYSYPGKGGKNRRKGKNDTEDKRELVFKEFGHGNTDLRNGN